MPRLRLLNLRAAMFAVGSSAVWTAASAAGPALPVPCTPGACGATGASQFVTGGSATAVATQNSLKINQSSNSAILNWSSFNIGAGGKVTFTQPSTSAIALNRIFQASPSQILGSLSANGQVYLVNLNGFVFGPTATVNTGSLLVSSLPLALTDANFTNGILSPIQNDGAVLDATLDPLAPGVGRTSVLDANGNAVLGADGKPLAVQVVVQPGAQLTAADQGRLLLAGQNVTNGGTLTAPDGQVILAAGAKVYLQASDDPSLRGLVVEVDGPAGTGTSSTAGAASGTASNTAWNQLTGMLSAPRGNITMVGLAVNQDGRISATTSVDANGSIRLEAADTATFQGAVVTSSQGGALTIGPQSQMEVLPELSSSATEVSAQPQLQSSVTLLGEQVIMQGGSIVAPDGKLTAIAAANPSPAAANPGAGVAVSGDPNARLRIDSGTTIDLSGSVASLPVTANLVAAQLRSTELADDPTQRDGALHGLTVYVDARDPPSALLADVSGEIAAVPQSVAQRTENGGNAVFQSSGDMVFASGASLNVSGGATQYAGGVMQTSYLVGANGQLYPIATANPLLTYVGVVNPTFTQTYNSWGVQSVVSTPGLSYYQPTYVQGAPAGSVQFAAPSMVLQGTLAGSASNGIYQRTPSTAVAGGQLIIGLPGGVGSSASTQSIDYLSPAVRLTTSAAPVVVADDAELPGPLTLDLPVSYLTSSGFTSTQIYSNYGVTLPGTPLVLPSGSTFSVDAARVDVLSSVTDPGGVLSFQNMGTVGDAGATALRPGVYVGEGVTLDVRGQWTNDMAADGVPTLASTWQNGGRIDLGTASPGALLSLADDVTLRVSGGAWLESTGTLVGGTGGSITLDENSVNGGLDLGNNVVIDGFGVNGAAGGTFNLTAPRVEIGAGGGNWANGQSVDDALAQGDVLQLHSSLFSGYGFETINITAAGLVVPGAPSSDLLSVDPGTAIDAVVGSLALNPRASLQPSATSLTGLAAVTTLAPYQRPAESVSLSALPPTIAINTSAGGGTSAGDIAIGAGASITDGAGADGGGSITLTSLGSILVDGALRAPAGTVDLHIVSPLTVNQTFEAGFLPTQRIELGNGSSIDVSGTVVTRPSSLDLTLGTVFAGGTVDLYADRGAVLADPGSLISVAGTSAALDVAQPNGTYIYGAQATAGGSISVHSGESISLLGGIDALAGAATAAAGSLDLALTRSENWWSVESLAAADTFSQYPLTVEILPSVAGLAPSAATGNQAVLGAAQLSQSGLDALRIEAGNTVELSGNFTLALNRQLVIDAPVIAATGGAQVNLRAPYLEVGYDHPIANGNSAAGGSGAVSFSGAEIDLVGTTVFQGTSDVSFASSGDLLLRGEATGTGLQTLQGGVTVAGNLTLDAERIYPVTATGFSITAAPAAGGAPGSVTIGQTGADPGTPLSAGGELSITADTVSSTGTLYAPFGTITLNAGTSLTLGDGSLTSVSGDGLTIPYGETQLGGEQWIYLPPGSGPQTVTGVPARAISLSAPAVTLAKQATIDLSGGGDLSAYEWVPGTGGTQDALAPGYSTSLNANLYAVLPSTRGQAAPQDPQNSDSAIAAGETVYLSGVAGLAAGFYPLLPARYALVPGALLIEAEPTFTSNTAGLLGTLGNGTPVVAGYYSYGSTGLHQTPGYTGFAIYPGSYGSELAQYTSSVASTYFSAAAANAGAPRPTLPADAGSLSISVQNSLDAEGQVLTAAASGGLAAPIDISAADLVIGTPAGTVPADAVGIAGSVLASWQPGSLLLGGTVATATAATASTPASTTIDVLANSVTVGAGTALTADQIVIVANQSIDVQNGASLRTTSSADRAAPATAPAIESVTLSSAAGSNAGFLALSDLNWLIPVRTAGSSAIGAATVAVDGGGSIASRGSLTLDAGGGVTLKGTATGPGAEWSLGSSSLAFVPAGAQADALSIDPTLVAQLDSAGAVRLASTGSIDLMTPVTLGVDASGAPSLESLTLSATSLNNLNVAGGGSGATGQFGAQTLVLEGPGASAATGAAGASGTLAFTAGTLEVGPGALAINGFVATRAAVSGAVVGQGTGSLKVGGDLTLAAAGVTAAAAADTDISATGVLTVMPAANAAGKVPQLLGGELSLSGGSVDISGTVTAPSGLVTLAATGGDLTVAAGAAIGAAGGLVSIGNQSAGTPGGSIELSAANDLTLASGATLNVSGAGTAAGGSVTLTAGGTASVGAALNGSGAGGASGGSFSLDAGTLAGTAAGNPLDSLAAALTAGGFNDSIDLRVRTGNLDLGAGAALSANTVALTADSGNIVIGGTVSADSGSLRGALSIFGGSGVELASGGALHADGSGAAGLGGAIEIGTGELVADQTGILDAYNGATISLDAGSTITAAGAAGEGTLLLRAPALLGSNDVGIQTLASDTRQVGQIIVEPVLPFNASAFSNPAAPTAADFDTVYQAVGTYMNAAGPTIVARLAPSGATPLALEAGVELIAPGNLLLQSADGLSPTLDLSPSGSNWRFFDGTPVDLTIRAAGNIEVANTLSDGFGSVSVGGVTQPTLLAGASSTFRLVAGADLSSANPLAVITGGTGTLTLDPGAVVRTGTGDIDLVAAQNIVVGGAGAGAYTAGEPAVAPGGTASDPYPDLPTAVGTSPAFANGVLVARTSLLMSYPAGGGNLLVEAGQDIVGAPLTDAAPTTWQLREGGSTYTQSGVSGSQTVLPTWGVNLAAYDWNFGTLGGGDLRISAGRDAIGVTAAAADSLLPQYGGAAQYVTSGGLSLTAGRNIGSAEVFLADGTGSVTAGGALTAVQPSLSVGDPNVGSGFFLQSSSLDVTARLGIAVDGAFDPTALTQTTTAKPLIGAFFSYSDGSALNLETTAGDIDLGAAGGAAQTLLGTSVYEASIGNSTGGVGVFPASLSVEALGGNIVVGPGIGNDGAVTLYPAPHGQLDLLAAQDIDSAVGAILIMSDAAPGSYATVASPLGKTVVGVQAATFTGDIHAGDTSPALVTAGGSIDELSLGIPKAATVVAGGDILDLTYVGQNLNTTDQTLLMAGGDFTYSQTYSGNGVSLGGPGQLDILAGRDVSLGLSQGVVTTGDLLNANLPTAQGADLTIFTGLGTAPDLGGFLTKIIAPSSPYQADLVAYVESLQNSSGLSFAAAETSFEAFSTAQQLPLIDQVFFNELSLSGIAANTVAGAGFAEGYAAIDALFPGSRAGTPNYAATNYAGDLTLDFSRIYTLSGGDINLVVPGGLINVGLANPPSTVAEKSPSELGIVAEGAGNVNIYTQGDVDVNASRIFTLGGGNILIWSDAGSIDAGQGAKTAVSAPPPSVLISSDGTVTLDFSGAAAGSGIRTIQTNPDLPLGNVDLVAPVGTVNAGDAGIGAAGNINIAASSVIGVANINFGGTATGVPAQVSSIGASLSGASSAASGATNTSTGAVANNAATEKESQAPLAQTALSWLDVFVTGLGEDNCKPDDIDCLKRQKTPTQ